MFTRRIHTPVSNLSNLAIISARALLIITWLMAAIMPASRAQAMAPLETPGDENWARGFHLQGGDKEVLAVIVDESDIVYAGGIFSAIDLTPANGLASWDGSHWSAFGDGFAYSDVAALAMDSSGNLYAGGYFYQAGTVSVNNIARWNGTAWEALGDGLNAQVRDLVFDDSGNLYAVGDFSASGSTTASHVAVWNGSSWQGLGSTQSINGDVYAIEYDATNHLLYIGGNFTSVNGISANRVARWNGSQWESLGFSGSGSVMDLEFDAANNLLYAGGNINYWAQAWNGTSWSSLGNSTLGGVPNALRMYNGSLYAGGLFTIGSEQASIARWNGSTWEKVAPMFDTLLGNQTIFSIAVDSQGRWFAGGRFEKYGDLQIFNIAMWDGATWVAMGSGKGNGILWQPDTLGLDSENNVMVGGFLTVADTKTVHNLICWDGEEWSDFPGNPNGEVMDIEPDGNGNLYIAGLFTSVGGVSAKHVAKWNGSSWSSLGANFDTAPMVLAYDKVHDLLYAGGYFTTFGSSPMKAIAVWDGSTWSQVGGGAYGQVWTMAVDEAGDLYAGGSYDASEGYANNIARWDGNVWHMLGSGSYNGVDSTVLDIVIDSAGNVYAGGYFMSAGGGYIHNIAKWNGSTWSSLAGSMNEFGTVTNLAFDSLGNLYAMGAFTEAGGVPVNHIAVWNGSEWSALGSGITAPYNQYGGDLLVDPGGRLNVTGYLMSAGGRGSVHFAQWTVPVAQPISSPGTYFFYENNSPITVTVTTTGTLGKLVIQRYDTSAPGAPPELQTGQYWKITGLDGEGDPAIGFSVSLAFSPNFTPDSQDKICTLSDSSWVCDITLFDSNTLTLTGVTHLSTWTLGNYGGAAESTLYLPFVFR
jgi:hypothetical protein